MNNSSLTRLTVIIIVSLHVGGEQETNVMGGSDRSHVPAVGLYKRQESSEY